MSAAGTATKVIADTAESAEGILAKIAQMTWELGSDVLGAVVGHWIVTEVHGDQKVRKLNTKQIRADAPHFAMDMADEAEFAGLTTRLDPGLKKNLEIQMGPVLAYGPWPVSGPPLHIPGIGDHQRADIILTIVEMICRRGMTIEAARDEAVKKLAQLAAISDPADWKRAAVADKLMRASENDYLGSKIQGQFKYWLEEAIKAERQMDLWANTRADEINTGTDLLEAQIDHFNEYGLIRKIWYSLIESTDLIGSVPAPRPRRTPRGWKAFLRNRWANLF